MFTKLLLLLRPVVLALLASIAPLARAQRPDTGGEVVQNGIDPAAFSGTEVRGAPVPEPTAAAVLAIGGGLAVMAALRRPPQE